MNVATVLIALLLAAVFIAIVGRGIHNRRKGKHACACGGCEGCGLCKQRWQ